MIFEITRMYSLMYPIFYLLQDGCKPGHDLATGHRELGLAMHLPSGPGCAGLGSGGRDSVRLLAGPGYVSSTCKCTYQPKIKYVYIYMYAVIHIYIYVFMTALLEEPFSG